AVGDLTSKLPLPDTGDVVLGDLPGALQANAFDTALFNEWLDGQIQSLRAQCEGYRPEHVVRYVFFPRYCGRVDDAVRTLEAWRTQVHQTAAAVVQARQAVTAGEESWQAAAARVRELETQRDGVMRQRLTQGETLSGLTSQAEALHANLVRAQQERARLMQLAQPEGWNSWLYQRWLESWRWIVSTVVVAGLAGFPFRTLWVNVWPSREMLTRQLVDDGLPGTATFEAPQATAEVVVQPGETVLVRNRSYLRKRHFGSATTRWIYDRNAWNSSVGAGLYFMTEVQPAADSNEPVSMTLAGKEVHQGTSQIIRVDLADHPGLVVRPDSLVALTEGMGVQVKSYWRQWPVTGQLRHVLLSGTGTIWLEGFGGIVGEMYDNSQAVQDMGPYLAYDGRLLAGFRRTDTKLPYVLGKTNLIETTLTGSGVFLWQRGEASAFANPISKSLEFMIAVISKALGL
ncbi:MAG: AIM24 family protein, partial [Myxococcales bacterium]|nr:AIM24 family protein [Myxococcales bacterium]